MLMKFSQLPFTGVFVSSFQVAKNNSSYIYLGNNESNTLTPEELGDVIWGSKMAFVLEELLIFTLWLIKACILLMYARLT